MLRSHIPRYFPSSCPFLEVNDVWGRQEKAKKRLRASTPYANWECGLCKKKFRSEHYIDLHMERNHFDEQGYFCLAEMCGAFENW